MSILKVKWAITSILGIIFIITTNTLLLIAYFLFPGNFNIFEHTASTLGNRYLNPNGALIFKLSNILGGIIFILFSLSLYQWYKKDLNRKNYFISSIIIGCFLGFSEIMVGIVSQEYRPYHLIWAIILFVSSALFLIVLGLFLIKDTNSKKLIGVITILIAMLHGTLIFYITNHIVIVEWIIISAFNFNIVLLSYNYYKLYKARIS